MKTAMLFCGGAGIQYHLKYPAPLYINDREYFRPNWRN